MEILIITIYILSMIGCFGIALYIFKDKWFRHKYPAGGAYECFVSIFIAFTPILNTVFSLLTIGPYILTKLKNYKK